MASVLTRSSAQVIGLSQARNRPGQEVEKYAMRRSDLFDVIPRYYLVDLALFVAVDDDSERADYPVLSS